MALIWEHLTNKMQLPLHSSISYMKPSMPANEEITQHLLNLNMFRLTSEGALPSYIPLHVSMPVIP
jgi:hypothetical protein